MAKFRFTSKHHGLVLQDGVDPAKGDGIWARFERGVFETDDAKVADRLRKVDVVTEDKAPATETPDPTASETPAS